MATFVLVPGAWLGAWSWEGTALALRERGHTALPMSLTGLAERASEGGPGTDLDTHIADITGFVERHDLHDVTLVGHSYAGAPVTGAAGRLGERLKRVVYVDSAPFTAGMSMLDLMPPEAADELRQQVDAVGDGWRLPMPSSEVLGLSSSLRGLDEAQRDLLRARATPQPFNTYTQRLTGPTEPGPDVDRVVVACDDFTALLDAGVPMLAFLNQPPWRRFDLPTGHWPMLSAPTELADVLDAAVS
ncbi:alpha/beta fold hydrolase [Streptoalloteichus hindustanus]|uniref:Pimeloyl-ACP methyl ester carboxylesterase n=1 Tax=Streptoalloteichus hindustanus TaxID=2017 RepID=A0A1M5FGK1_STRHI|nr:alpha/beta fold hydrolase [Streptoalloteichus hindustanus]SHF90680.1 Pimeloyl-ACP methyl ester carboxylesterase [Streptoalloteichus hindustanus]